jgi:hypothetical protein
LRELRLSRLKKWKYQDAVFEMRSGQTCALPACR